MSPAKQSAAKDNEPKAKASGQQAIRYPFWFGGSAASMAAVATHPLDLGKMAHTFLWNYLTAFVVKVRLQTRAPDAPKTMTGTFVNIVRKQGPLGLYNGLSAALLRQLTYSTVRFGVYEDLKTRFGPTPTADKPNPKTPLLHLVAMSSVAGALGGIVGNPGDVLNVRMQSDFAKPPAERRNYKHAGEGLVRMARDEGPASLMRGVGANSSRALLMTASQLASYDVFKGILLSPTTAATLHYTFKDNLVTHFTASLAAGFVATTVCSPVDVIKTRIMSAKAKQGIMDILRSAVKEEGYLWMFRGWVPSFIRLGPQVCFPEMRLVLSETFTDNADTDNSNVHSVRRTQADLQDDERSRVNICVTATTGEIYLDRIRS